MSKPTDSELLEGLLIRGTSPHPLTLEDMGLDLKYLARTVEIVKSEISSLPSYGLMKNAINPTRDNGRWHKLAEASGYGDVPCLRLVTRHESLLGYQIQYAPLLRLSPVTGGRDVDIELFITWRGEWIVYHGSQLHDEKLFTEHGSTEKMCTRLAELAGDTYRYSPRPYTYAIADHLVKCLRDNIEESKRRLHHKEATIAEYDILHKRFFGS